MTTRDRWLDEGVAVLAEQGAAGIRIDRIAARLGVTKGSFHHHFAGIEDYRRALLDRCQAAAMAEGRRALAATAELPPEQVLMDLPSTATFDPRLDAALRGWASEDDEARAVQESVDAARLEALTALWLRTLGDPVRARTAALVPHLLLVGASVAQPRPTAGQLREVFSLLAALVPAVRELATAPAPLADRG